MRHLCYSKIFFLWLALTLSLFATTKPSVAFYYGNDPSESFIQSYDWIIVDADQIDTIWTKRYGKKLFAYVSVGEFEAWRHKEKSSKVWELAQNQNWHSTVMDLSNPEYQNFLLAKMQQLYKKGYQNFFLDTLDAAFGTTKDRRSKEKQKNALTLLLDEIRTRFPKSTLIANRGVEVMNTLCQKVDAFAIESLYKGIDAQTKSYIDVKPKDRTWIRAKLNDAKECGLLPIVIDYLPEEKQKERRKIVDKITHEGYIPYVTDRYLQHFGQSTHRRLKREVLLLYDTSTLKDGDKVYSNVHLMSSMPLEYLGYIPVLKDIHEHLPYGGVDRYAGVVIWANQNIESDKDFFTWIYQLIRQGQKVLFLNSFGFEMDVGKAKKLGFDYTSATPSKTLFAKIIHKSQIANAEIPPLINAPSYLLKAKEGKVFIQAENNNKEHFDAAAIMPWGGYADFESAVRDIDSEPMWSIDPFVFFQKALHKSWMPVPDPTTENGRRILFIHIDGDGFIEKSRFNTHKYASQILLDDILKNYPLPHSISIIEGEIGKRGLYPNLAPKMQTIARKIFAKSCVEIASHSYSHPFKWQKLEESNTKRSGESSYHLPIPGYHFNLKREIEGSVGFINSKLAPKNKKCELFFWTGDCLPREDALRMTELNGLKAINGGDTTATKANPWLGRIAPFGLQRGAFWQIYVGEQNENIYTNDWLGPYWGYRKVLETFAITQKPKRLKPINIYYHFYSASKIASLNALHRVYKWAMQQPTIPLYTSEYIDIAHDFYDTAITQTDNSFLIQNNGFLRTLRIPSNAGYPDIVTSSGILGWKDEGNIRYIHLDGNGSYRLILQTDQPNTPYLIEANGKVKYFKSEKDRYYLTLSAHVPLYARFYLPKGWKLQKISSHVKRKRKGVYLTINAPKNKKTEICFVRR